MGRGASCVTAATPHHGTTHGWRRLMMAVPYFGNWLTFCRSWHSCSGGQTPAWCSHAYWSVSWVAIMADLARSHRDNGYRSGVNGLGLPPARALAVDLRSPSSVTMSSRLSKLRNQVVNPLV
jgi:hypothetical protein